MKEKSTENRRNNYFAINSQYKNLIQDNKHPILRRINRRTINDSYYSKTIRNKKYNKCNSLDIYIPKR